MRHRIRKPLKQMDAERFRQTITPIRDTMFRVALGIMGSEDDALDAIQDTVVRLWTNRRLLAAASNSQAYCIGALRKQCLSMIRTRRDSVALESCDLSDSDHDAAVSAIESRDSLRIIRQIIQSLPQGQKRAIELSVFSQCSNEDIARITGFSEQNVRTLLSRARRRIKELFTLHSPN